MTDKEKERSVDEAEDLDDIFNNLTLPEIATQPLKISASKEENSKIKKRPRGVLSHTDREYLFGLREYEHPQSESNRKQKIRERIRNAFSDFPVLLGFLDSEEREKIFKELEEDEDLERYLESIIGFLFETIHKDEKRFENIIERGIYSVAKPDTKGGWAGPVMMVDTSIDINYQPGVKIPQQKLKEGKGSGLTPTEIGVLVRAGELRSEDLEDLEITEEADSIYPENNKANEEKKSR